MTSQRTCLFALLTLAWSQAAPPCAQAQPAAQTSENNAQLREGLKRFPEADANKDGILTMEEAQAFLARRQAAEKARRAAAEANQLKPSLADVPYGPHPRNVLDFWVSKSTRPAPLVVFIHGGGFRAGGKESWRSHPLLAEMVNSGMACAAINYRFLDTAPIQTILLDCAHAVQFLRSKAGDWNIDKTRIAAMGSSAGAGTSLWLATHDDVAQPGSGNPVLKESSRVSCAVLSGTQATYDVTKWESFLGPLKPGFWADGEVPLFYGFKSMAQLAAPGAREILHECDMLAWISKDDAPVCISNPLDVKEPSSRNEWLHCTRHAREVKKQYDAMGVECVLVQDEKDPKTQFGDFIRRHLKAAN